MTELYSTESFELYSNEIYKNPLVSTAAYNVCQMFGLSSPMEVIYLILTDKISSLQILPDFMDHVTDLLKLCVMCDKWDLFNNVVEKYNIKTKRLKFALQYSYWYNRADWIIRLYTKYAIFHRRYVDILSIKQLEFLLSRMRKANGHSFPFRFFHQFKRRLDDYLSLLEKCMPTMPSDIIGIIGDFHCYQDL